LRGIGGLSSAIGCRLAKEQITMVNVNVLATLLTTDKVERARLEKGFDLNGDTILASCFYVFPT